MAKYIVSFMVLILLILENNSIFKRLCVNSLPSRQMRHHQLAHHHRTLHEESLNSQHTSRHHRHKRMHHTTNHKHKDINNKRNNLRHKVQNTDSDSDRDRDEIIAKYLLRHRIHQIENLQKHHEQYQRRTRSSPAELRSMPRPWTQLLMKEENMYGDEPFPSNEEEENSDFLLPIHDDDNDDDDDGANEVNFAELDYDANERKVDNSESIEVESVELHPVDIAENYKHKSHNHNPSGYRCPKCESQRKVEHITEEELTRLRIEFVKTQILEKLRLKERPNVSAVALPKPIQEGVTIDQGDEHSKNKELDDYYARTSKKFIFLERETRECERTGIKPSVCFSFKIDDADADGFDVSTAVLWIFKNRVKSSKLPKSPPTSNEQNNTLRYQETIVVSEVQQPLDLTFQPIVKTIAIQTIVDQDKWLEIDIEWPIKRWFGNHDLSHLIQISCESCDISEIDRFDKDYRPFIMIDTQNRRRVSRQKRGINCTDGVTECCREKLYISFEEIGWGDWIIQPRGYDAYFCRGSCGSIASITQSSSHHSTFLQKVVAMSRGKGSEPLELIPCCTANKYSSLQLVFMDSNNTATQKTFPNMVVESCGCR